MDFSPTVRELLRSMNNTRYPHHNCTQECDPIKLDSRLCFLPALLEAFGERAVQAVMLGLSRPFRPTRDDVEALIDEWERRNEKCCYDGSVEDLFKLRNTWIFAVSFKHAPAEMWTRKNSAESNIKRECKMFDEDQELLKEFVTGYSDRGKETFIMVWCDRVLATRLKSEGNTSPFYQHGLLPYATFPVLQLSTHIPEQEIEKRTWIRAERSLGRLCYGFIDGHDASLGVFAHPGKQERPAQALRHVANMIVSGYWPEDREIWEEDFKHMRTWAIGVLCRGEKFLLELPLFEQPKKVDNYELLSRIDKFAKVPPGLEYEEAVQTNGDERFFLKATAWNLSLKKHCWDENPGYACHDMANLGDARFTWWHADRRNYVFGVLADYPSERSAKPTLVLAKAIGTKYRVFRTTGDLVMYSHAEREAGPQTMKTIKETAAKAKFEVPSSLKWELLYTSDDSLMNAITHRDLEEVLNPLQLNASQLRAEVMIPSPFHGITTKLYMTAIAKGDTADQADIARHFITLTEEWNKIIRGKYSQWLSLKDTVSGPVWLEGFNNKEVTFGYLEYITERVILGESSDSPRQILLRTPWEAICDIRENEQYMTEDEIHVTRELLPDSIDEDNCREKFTVKDVARYTLFGGFSSHFRLESARSFLAAMAESRGYWSTLIVCTKGKIQIRFRNSLGKQRIAQRPTKLSDFAGIGFVHPDNSDAVQSVSIPLDDEKKRHFMLMYWKEMRDTTTRKDVLEKFPSSRRVLGDNRRLCAVDMTMGEQEQEEEQLLKAENLVEFRCSFLEVDPVFDGSHADATWKNAYQMAQLDQILVKPSLETTMMDVLDVERKAGETLRMLEQDPTLKSVPPSEMERLLVEAAQDEALQASKLVELERTIEEQTEKLNELLRKPSQPED